MPAPLVPEDDLYRRLELTLDASPEAIELAWRALLKRHHPDVAGEDVAAVELAKRINIAHDWLSDPALRRRYDRERLGVSAPPERLRRRDGVRYGMPPRRSTGPAGPTARAAGAASAGRSTQRRTDAPAATRASTRLDLVRGSSRERIERFLDRVSHLTADELDRLAVAEPPPIAFLATLRRVLPPGSRETFAGVEAAVAERVAHERWAEIGVREGLGGVAAELALAAFLDENLDEPFRGRARERLLRAWEASVDQPRYGPNGTEVAALREGVASITAEQLARFLRASAASAGHARPWPPSLDRAEDEALRISALLAARDVAAALTPGRFPTGAAARARRLLGRLGHVVALRHAYPPATYEALVAPWRDAVAGAAATPQPGVRRAR